MKDADDAIAIAGQGTDETDESGQEVKLASKDEESEQPTLRCEPLVQPCGVGGPVVGVERAQAGLLPDGLERLHGLPLSHVRLKDCCFQALFTQALGE